MRLRTCRGSVAAPRGFFTSGSIGADLMKMAIVHNHPISYRHLALTSLRSVGLDFEAR
jgi:hypothetical protein